MENDWEYIKTMLNLVSNQNSVRAGRWQTLRKIELFENVLFENPNNGEQRIIPNLIIENAPVGWLPGSVCVLSFF